RPLRPQPGRGPGHQVVPGVLGGLACIDVSNARTLWYRRWPEGLGDPLAVVPLADGKHGLVVDHTAQRVKIALTPEAKDGERVQGSDKTVSFGGTVAYSADGKRFASFASSGANQRLHVFDADSWDEGPEIQLLPGKHVAALVLSRDGKHVAAGCEDHLIQVAEVEKGGQVHRVQLPLLNLGFNRVQTLAFSWDNKFLIAGHGPTVYLI